MTLEVRDNIGIGASQEATAQATWDSYDDVVMWLSLQGIDPAAKPPFPRPVILPEQYANLEGAAYSILMGQVDRWFEYVGSLQAQLKGSLIAIKNERDIIGVDFRAEVRRKVKDKTLEKVGEAELKDQVKEIPRYRELLKNEQDIEIALLQVDSLLESLNRYAKGLSRQVTIRGQEIEVTNMEGGKRPPRRLG